MSLGETIELSLIKEIELLAAKRAGSISLAQGIPSFDTPEAIKRRAIEAIRDGRVAQYSLTPGLLDLREEIEEILELEGMTYDFENEIIVTVGSIGAITATLLAILEPGDEVLLPSPTYTSYVQAIKVARGVPVFVPLDEGNGWRLNAAAFEEHLRKNSRAILLCNPNNPTGTIFPKEELLKIGEIAMERNIVILSDEVYKDFIFDKDVKENFFSLAKVKSLRRQVVRIFSFSKAYAMTGWRIGYLHTDRTLAKHILKIHDSLVTCAPVISQHAAMAALRLKPEEMDPYFDEYRARRQILCDGLNQLKDYLSYVYPEATYFVFPKINDKIMMSNNGSIGLAKDMLEQVGLAVVPGVAFGPEGENHIRLSFGRSREDIVEGLRRLTKYFNQI